MTKTPQERTEESIAEILPEDGYMLTGDRAVDIFHMKAYSSPWYVVRFPVEETKLREEAIKSLDNLLKRQGYKKYQKTGQQGNVISLGGQYPLPLRLELMQMIHQYHPDAEWTEYTYKQYLDSCCDQFTKHE